MVCPREIEAALTELWRADDLALDEGSHARSVAVHEGLLDAHCLVRGDLVARQGTEAGGDSVNGATLFDGPADDGERGRHAPLDVV